MSFKRLVTCVILTAITASCGSIEHWDEPEGMIPANLFGAPSDIPNELHGVWASEGYGWILTISDAQVELLDVSSSVCIEAKDTLEEYESYFHTYALDPNSKRLGLRGKFEDYTYYFSPLDAKPNKCAQQVESTPLSNFDYLAEIMSTHYAFFDVRDVNWDEIVAENRALISPDISDDDLWAILKSMIEGIDDGHVTLSRMHEGRRQTYMPGRGRTQNSVIPLAASLGKSPGPLFGEWYEDYKASILSELLSDQGKIIARDRVIYGMVDEEIGYLNILKMGGYVEGLEWTVEDFQIETDALNAALDEAILHVSGARGIIVDATYNGGGFDYLGREISARFTKTPVLGSYRSPANIETVSPQPLYTFPTSRPSFDGPVVVLSSNLTMSASESFIMHMKAMPQIEHMGEATRGALSEVLSKTLPNGWSVSISNENYLDGNMQTWEGLGVPPDIPRQIFDPNNIFDGHLEAVHFAADYLRDKTKSKSSEKEE